MGKTKKGLGRVHLPQELADDLWLWKQECPDSSLKPSFFRMPRAGCHNALFHLDTTTCINQESPVLVIYGSIPLMILNVCSNAWGSFMRKERRMKMGPSGMP